MSFLSKNELNNVIVKKRTRAINNRWRPDFHVGDVMRTREAALRSNNSMLITGTKLFFMIIVIALV